MSPKTEEKILDKLDRIEHLLVKVIYDGNFVKDDEDDVLNIIDSAEKEFANGKSKVLKSFSDLD